MLEVALEYLMGVSTPAPPSSPHTREWGVRGGSLMPRLAESHSKWAQHPGKASGIQPCSWTLGLWGVGRELPGHRDDALATTRGSMMPTVIYQEEPVGKGRAFELLGYP